MIMNKEDQLLSFPPRGFVQLINGSTVVTVQEFNSIMENHDNKKQIVIKVLKKTIIRK